MNPLRFIPKPHHVAMAAAGVAPNPFRNPVANPSLEEEVEGALREENPARTGDKPSAQMSPAQYNAYMDSLRSRAYRHI